MKANSLQSLVLENKWRRALLLFALITLICLAVTSGLAQLKNQKRVTALQLGQAAEGARVTIVSDSALNDYEAFRRGDRFYVKIPLADFAAAQPNFRGNGFEDIRVQKVGDSVIVSFKLQPGATARVDQRSNRLDVIFSAVGVARSVPAATTVNTYPTSRNRRNTGDSDASAGPIPPMSTSRVAQSERNYYSDPVVDTPTRNSGGTIRGTRSPRRSVTETAPDQGSKGKLAADKLPSRAQSSVPPPTSSAATRPSPVNAPGAFATPYGQQPAAVPVSSRTQEATGWESRIKFLKAWAKLNRSALIGGGLLVAALLVGLVLWSRLKGRRTAAGKAPRKTPAKPSSEKVVGRPVIEGEPFAGSPGAAAPVAATPVAAAAMPHKDVWVPQPAPDQEREVFEL